MRKAALSSSPVIQSIILLVTAHWSRISVSFRPYTVVSDMLNVWSLFYLTQKHMNSSLITTVDLTNSWNVKILRTLTETQPSDTVGLSSFCGYHDGEEPSIQHTQSNTSLFLATVADSYQLVLYRLAWYLVWTENHWEIPRSFSLAGLLTLLQFFAVSCWLSTTHLHKPMKLMR